VGVGHPGGAGPVCAYAARLATFRQERVQGSRLGGCSTLLPLAAVIRDGHRAVRMGCESEGWPGVPANPSPAPGATPARAGTRLLSPGGRGGTCSGGSQGWSLRSFTSVTALPLGGRSAVTPEAGNLRGRESVRTQRSAFSPPNTSASSLPDCYSSGSGGSGCRQGMLPTMHLANRQCRRLPLRPGYRSGSQTGPSAINCLQCPCLKGMANRRNSFR
jgi:hypothetical protein